MQTFRRFLADNLWLVLVGPSLFFIGSATLNAQTNTWTDNTEDNNWFTDGNWNTLAEPTGTSAVVVNNGRTAQIAMPGAVAMSLTIGATVPGSTVQLLPGGDLTVNAANNVVIGPGGTLEFSGGVNAGGNLTVESGTIDDDGNILFDGTLDHSLSAIVTGTGKLTMAGTGTLTLTGASNYTGGTTISSGTILIGTGGSIPGNVADNGTLTFDQSGLLTVPGNISGTGSVTQIGTGTTILSGNNTYTGSTTISAGTLEAGSVNGFSQNSAFTVNSILDLHGFNNTIGSLTGNGIVLNNNGQLPAVLTVGNDNTNTTFNGVLEDGATALGLTKSGSGTLTLTGTNFYTGGTTIGSGTIQLGNGGTTGSITGNVTNNGILAFDRSDAPTFAGVISGPGSVAQIGPGTTILTGDNTYTGSTTISAGTLQLGNGGTTGSIAGNVTNNGTLAFDRSDTLTLAGDISGTGSVNQTGGGTTILAGNNTYAGGTTISAGTLEAGSANGLSQGSAFTVNSILDVHGFSSAIGSLSGTGTVLNNGQAAASLTVGSDNTSTSFNGVLENGTSPLELIKSGTGTLTLTGSNTYTAGTAINAGTLQLGNGGTSGSITGNVADNGSLTFDRSDTLTFGGSISGAGSVTQIGTGTTILTGDNTYTGSTTISSGTLQAGSTTALSQNSAFAVNSTLDLNGFNNTIGSLSGSGTVLNNGATTATLTTGNDNTDTTYSGALENGTSVLQLTKLGAGTLTLTGANTYTGGTTISAGTLQIGSGGTSGSIAGDVIDNGTLAFDRSDSVNFPGVISGMGNLAQLGTGTLILSGANTYTGSTTVNSGSLIVDGSIASSQTVVNPNGFLGGHGTIGGNLVNSGTVGQINSPGMLTVAGNYTQNANGTLRVGVAGLGAGQFDLLAVTGHAAVAGTLQFVRVGSFNLQPGNQITFLTANNGVSGTFGTVQNGIVGTGTIVQVEVTSLANSIVLEGTQGSFLNTPGVATTPNNAAVAKALDSAIGDPREAALFAFLNSQPLANLPHDLTLIAPAQVSSINATAVSVGKVQIANVGQRLANIRGGSTGFSSAGFSLNGDATSSGEGFAGVSGPEGKSGPPVFAPTPDNRWGVFVTGLGEFSNVDSTTNAAGYDVDTGGFTFGVDYRLTPNFAIGLTGGYAHTSVNLDGGGNIDVNGGKLGGYATLFGNGFYLDAAVTGGPSGYNTHRTALQGTASGSTDGADFNTLVAAGYDWKIGNLSVGPTASFQYSYIGLNSFTETGSLAPLKFPDQNTESERSAFGARASYDWKIGQITVIPQVSAAWQHEYGDTAYSIVSGFATGAGKSFTVTGPEIGRDSVLVGAGATVIWNDRVSTYLYYDGEFARTNYLSNNVSGGVRISF